MVWYDHTELKYDYNYSKLTSLAPIAEQCLQIQFASMMMSVLHCHTFKHWQTVHNLLLEKIPGFPLVDKLRIIHIYEADWSLIQKYYISYKLNNIASRERTIPIEQAGGRPGRSSIELAASRELTYKTIRLQKLYGAVLYNDAKACYDQIIENLSNLTLLREELPLQIAQLHSQTYQSIEYNIKHRLGIGTKSNSHNFPLPVYGVGQVATDSPARWGFVCNHLINIYKNLASDATIESPDSLIHTNIKIAGFVDDTATLMIQKYHNLYIIIQAEQNTQVWEVLLYTSGGKLAIPKCDLVLFQWIADQHGQFTLDNTTKYNLHVRNSETNQTMLIPQISTSTSYKYVGVQIALDGNMTQQIKDLQIKCTEMATIFNQTYFNATDTKLGFTTVFTPSICYPLATASITKAVLQNIQKPVVHAVLSRMGFNCHMPQAVVFGSRLRGGMGLLNLPTEQGACQIQLLISHIRSNSYLKDTILILLQSFQLQAGILKFPLQDTAPLQYINSPWLQSIQCFLASINTTIVISQKPLLLAIRDNDTPILRLINETNFTKSKQEMLNACRLDLQVTTLSEITNTALYGRCNIKQQPNLWLVSTSKLTWPQQHQQSQKAWTLWKKYLQLFTTNNGKLHQKLGKWQPNCHLQRHWNFVSSPHGVIQTNASPPKLYSPIPSRTRFSNKYQYNRIDWSTFSELNLPITPIIMGTDTITCTHIQSKGTPSTYSTHAENTEVIQLPEQAEVRAYAVSTHTNSMITTTGMIWYNKTIVSHVVSTSPIFYNPTQHAADSYGTLMIAQHLQSL
jgi:hypothetical protein